MEKTKSRGSMPETKGEKILFGILMSVLMTGGMEVYNNAIQMGYATLPGGLSNMRAYQRIPDIRRYMVPARF